MYLMLKLHKLFDEIQKRTRQVGWSNKMYHAIVRREGVWVSFGLHIPSQWSDAFHTLQRVFDSKNVSYIFWSPDDELTDVYTVQTREQMDIILANQAQDDWDAGNKFYEINDENGQLNITAGIAKLRQDAQKTA